MFPTLHLTDRYVPCIRMHFNFRSFLPVLTSLSSFYKAVRGNEGAPHGYDVDDDDVLPSSF